MLKFICVTVVLVFFESTQGYSRLRGQIPNGYNVKHPCPGKGIWDAVGHMKPQHDNQKNKFGEAMKAAGLNWPSICNLDSDGDGLTNGAELGDPGCKWQPGDRDPGPVLGHPGFCEPDRSKCDGGLSHPECPNLRGGSQIHGGGQGFGVLPRTPPPEANDHPQTLFTKGVGPQSGRGMSQSRFGFGRPQSTGSFGQPQSSFGQQQTMFGQPQSTFGQGQPQSSFSQPQSTFGQGQPQSSFSQPHSSFSQGQPQLSLSQPQSSFSQGQPSFHAGQSIFGVSEPAGTRMSGMGSGAGSPMSSPSWGSQQSTDFHQPSPSRGSPSIDMFNSILDQQRIQGGGRANMMNMPSRPQSFSQHSQSSMFMGQTPPPFDQRMLQSSVQNRIQRAMSLGGGSGGSMGGFSGGVQGGLGGGTQMYQNWRMPRTSGFQRPYPF